MTRRRGDGDARADPVQPSSGAAPPDRRLSSFTRNRIRKMKPDASTAITGAGGVTPVGQEPPADNRAGSMPTQLSHVGKRVKPGTERTLMKIEEVYL
jgi:hypothetical protein